MSDDFARTYLDETGRDPMPIACEALAMVALRGRSLGEFSGETVQMFYDDAVRSGLTAGGVKAR